MSRTDTAVHRTAAPSDPINKRSDHLVVLVPTHDRLELLKRTLDSIATGTSCDHEVIVIDGGSTDGTIEYLQGRSDVTSVFQGRLLGVTRAYNEVWRRVDSTYTCWLSDDTEVLGGSLDVGVKILEEHPDVGIVGLKMKDTLGPWTYRSYKGGLSHYRIMGCQHAMLRTDVLRAIGYANEDYRSYTWAGDISASVMCAGLSIVHLREIALLHHREWAETEDVDEKIAREMGGIDNQGVYRRKFAFLGDRPPLWTRIKRRLFGAIGRVLFAGAGPDANRLGLNREDWFIVGGGRFVSALEPLRGMDRSHHLVQNLPRRVLESEGNPYRHLVGGWSADGREEART